MATYATQDDLNALASLVRTLEDNVTTLDDSVGELDSLVDRINHMETLKDVTITYITEGDVLQYSSDGTWHNVQPGLLNINAGDTDGSPVDSTIVKALILSEGAKLFLSKKQDDVALGQITFQNGLVGNGMVYLNEGVQIGNYVPGIMGTGAKIDKDGRAELTSLTIREFLEVPELRFNKIDIVSGELWNSIAVGTIESVDEENQIFTVKLEEGEYNGLHVNDICRGIFHNINGQNETTETIDDSGFHTVQGFGTSYFTPIEVYGEYNKYVKYALKPGCKYHPKSSMKFAVYGNFTDETRRNSAYSTRTYKRFLKGVQTWGITWENIASQFGELNGLNIPGAPNNGNLEGNGAYLSNVYMTDALIQFTPQQEENLKGKDGYSVNLTRYETTIIVDNDFNVITDYQQAGQMEFGIQAFKGPVELTYDNVYGEGKYFVEYEAVGCSVTFGNGVFKITEVTNPNSEMYIDIIVNCEGVVNIKQRFNINYQLEGNSVWVTYYDGDELPPVPTGDGTSNGWHRNFTSTAIWMSSKSSRRIEDGVWGDPVRFVGASIAGKDGQYTAFVYTNSSNQPATPVQNSGIPPSDPYGTLTWYLYPPERLNNSVYVWMSQAVVYADKTMSGWTEPIRLTGDDGQDGVDGLSLEFIYQVTTEYKSPATPNSPTDQDDPDLSGTGWTDSPSGVSKDAMYEWVSQRRKERDKEGIAKWGPYTAAVLWSKWGEKGMDGDGYEYIYTRTADIDIVPSTPNSVQQDDFVPTISNGASIDYNWSDDPKGLVSEEYKAEWVCVRNKTNGVWSNYSTPALWSNWGEQGMQGAHYIYRWTISTTTPEYYATAVNPNKGNTTWVNDSEIQATEANQFVWQIQCLSNPDGTQGEWGNLIRLTGANGKDGEDGNSIEFLYARNNTGIAPSTPPTNQITDWTGTVQDINNNTTVTWYDNPQGVTQNIMYEYVCQRYFDKVTQQWGAYSKPGVWARYSEKGKDGDGYEYIYRQFGSYQSQSAVSPGGTYYPDTSSSDYQNDEYVPTNYTDNPVGTSSTLKYEYVWTRKKKNGVWGAWSDGAMWSRYAVDGADGEKGDKGDKGDDGANGESATTYIISPGSSTIRLTKTASYVPSSMTFKAYYKTGTGSITACSGGKWEVYGSDSQAPTSASNGTEIGSGWQGGNFTFNPGSYTRYTYYTVAYHPSEWPIYNGNPVAASVTITTVVDGSDGDAADNVPYVITRFRGVYNSNNTYYYKTVSSIDGSNNPNNVPNFSNAYYRDYVICDGLVWFVKSQNSSTSSKPSSSSSYWTKSTSYDIMDVNTLISDTGQLGDFQYDGGIFKSTNNNLILNSSDGSITSTKGTIGGFTIGTSTLSAGSTYPMTITTVGTGDFTSSGIVWKDTSGNRLLSMGVNSSGGDIRVRNSSLNQVSIFPGAVSVQGSNHTITINGNWSSNHQMEFLRSASTSQSFRLGIDSSGTAYIYCAKWLDLNGSTTTGGRVYVREHDGHTYLCIN